MLGLWNLEFWNVCVVWLRPMLRSLSYSNKIAFKKLIFLHCVIELLSISWLLWRSCSSLEVEWKLKTLEVNFNCITRRKGFTPAAIETNIDLESKCKYLWWTTSVLLNTKCVLLIKNPVVYAFNTLIQNILHSDLIVNSE